MAGVPNFCSKTNGPSPPPPPSEEKCGSHGGERTSRAGEKFAADPICSLPFPLGSFTLPVQVHPVFKSFGSAVAAAAGNPKYTFESLPTAKSDMPPDISVFEENNPPAG